jgi:spermidine/putrescine-binding protein
MNAWHILIEILLKEAGKMLRPEDIDKMDYDLAKAFSKESSVVILKLESGTIATVCGYDEDDGSVQSTENGPVLSQKGIDSLGGAEYLFIPKGSHNKDD